MIEKIKDIYTQYSDQILTWYEGLSELYQYGVIFLLIAVSLLIVAIFILSRITK
jgi:hypothetical protein